MINMNRPPRRSASFFSVLLLLSAPSVGSQDSKSNAAIPAFVGPAALHAPGGPSAAAPGFGRVAGPIQVNVSASTPSASTVNLTWFLINHGPEPVSVVLRGDVRWPNGAVRTVTRPKGPMLLDPGLGISVSGPFPVPASAGLGEGEFRLTAVVTSHDGRGTSREPWIAQDRATFQLQ